MTADLLAEALLHDGPRRIGGYTALGPALSVNVADDFALQLTPLTSQQPALRIESGFPPWLSLEGWLAAVPDATACRIGIALLAERDCHANAFLRVIGTEGFGIDGPAQRLALGGGEACLTLPLDPAEARPRKVVLLIDRPPAVLILRGLTLTQEGGA